jgi:hypothetical protein
MTLIRRAGSFFAFTVVLACASDNLLLPPQGLKFAFAQGACGPADGPALTIFLTRDPSNGPSPVAPYVRIYISDAATVDGRTLEVTGPSAQANASYTRIDNATETLSEEAQSGHLVATHSSNDNSIVGSVDITFATAGRLAGGFNAPLFPLNAYCP